MSSSRKILVLGAQGQLGRALMAELGNSRATSATRHDLDLNHPQSCYQFLEATHPSAVLNAAAFTQVDLAEKETEAARKVNSESPAEMARWCSKNKVPFIHFSTDYVFSGSGTTPWKETDPIAPLNAYGKTKAEGEMKVVEQGGSHLIFRTSWVYDSHGKNFLNTMLKFGRERDSLKIVDDQFGAPTFAHDLARAAIQALESSSNRSVFPSGIYHLCNQGETTWFGFANAIFELARSRDIPLKVKELIPLLSKDFPTPAQRPKNSRLCTTKMHDVFGIRLPEWQDSLKVCMQEVLP